jgi:hypothetical protein
MRLKRHDLLPSLCFLVLLSLLILTFLALARQSVEVRAYDAHTGALLFDAIAEELTPVQRQRTSVGWLFLGINRRLSVHVSSAGYLPSDVSWHASSPWSLWGQLDVPLVPTQLTGIVRDAETGLSLPGAEVWIGTEQVVADASGMFYRSTLSGGESIKVYLEGYDPWQGEVLGASHLFQNERLTVTLEPNSVEGYVRWHETGEPLPGATVKTAGQESVTDGSGCFRLSRLRRGDIITVQLDGFWPAKVTYSGQPVAIALKPKLFEGVVRWHETGEPLPGATVKTAGQESVTDGSGCFRLSRLRQGDIITVQLDGFWPAKVVYTDQSADVEVALHDRRTQVVVASALQDVELTNLIVTRNGQPLVPTSIGDFELRAWTPGELLEATASGHWPSQTRLELPDRWSVGEEETVQMLLQPRVLTVTVRDGYTGRPLMGALVKSSPPQLANDQGQVTLAPAIPGMAITIEYPGYISQTIQYDVQTSELEASLLPHTIRGVVVDDETGKPVPNAAFRQDGQTLLHADLDGGFCMEGITERPIFTVRAPGYRPAQVIVGDHASPIALHPCPVDAASGGGLCSEIRIAPFQARGVYIPFGLLNSRDRTLAVLDMISNTELNAVVVDVKGDRGWLAYVSDLALAKELGVSVNGLMDINEFLDICRQRDIYTIARLVVFKDNPLAHGKTDLAVKQADGSVWLDREELGWANPYRQEVWDYNIGIATEVAQLGFDEIQLDYLRFPSDGDLTQIVYEEEDSLEAKTTAIRTFLSQMREALEPYDVFLSADVFGLTLVVTPQSDMGIGQRVIDIAPLVDYLCPMVYPSTFISGNMGIANPALNPYNVVSQSLRQGMGLTSTRIRPWLQAYSFDGVKYGLVRQDAQRRAAEMVGADGWTFWNASGFYDERLFRQCTGGNENCSGDEESEMNNRLTAQFVAVFP